MVSLLEGFCKSQTISETSFTNPFSKHTHTHAPVNPPPTHTQTRARAFKTTPTTTTTNHPKNQKHVTHGKPHTPYTLPNKHTHTHTHTHSLELAYMLEGIEGDIEVGVDEVVENFGERMGKYTDTKVVYQIIYL